MTMFILICIYWTTIYLLLDFILEKNKKYLFINITYNKSFVKTFSFLKKFKEYLPSVSRFNKDKIMSSSLSYLEDYDQELSKALLMHLIPFLFTLPFLFFGVKYFFINLVFIFLFNILFVIIIVYNKMRIQKIIIIKKEKNEQL